jgi:hypothetical protein
MNSLRVCTRRSMHAETHLCIRQVPEAAHYIPRGYVDRSEVADSGGVQRQGARVHSRQAIRDTDTSKDMARHVRPTNKYAPLHLDLEAQLDKATALAQVRPSSRVRAHHAARTHAHNPNLEKATAQSQCIFPSPG